MTTLVTWNHLAPPSPCKHRAGAEDTGCQAPRADGPPLRSALGTDWREGGSEDVLWSCYLVGIIFLKSFNFLPLEQFIFFFNYKLVKNTWSNKRAGLVIWIKGKPFAYLSTKYGNEKREKVRQDKQHQNLKMPKTRLGISKVAQKNLHWPNRVNSTLS